MKKIFLFVIFSTNILFMQTGCGFYFQDIEYKRAKDAAKSNKYKDALFHYTRVIKKSPERAQSLKAANEAARIALLNTKDFYAAISFLEFIVLYSQETEKRSKAQEQIAFIYFDRLNDYESAIKEYSRLLALPLENLKKIEFKFKVAKAFYYLNKFSQSVLELDSLLKQKLTDEDVFAVRLFKANVLLTKKDFDRAIEEYELLLEEFPEKSVKEKLDLVVAVAYEDKNEFHKAIETLEKMKEKSEDPDFIEIKIKRLKERISNQPKKKERYSK
ncbi:MAG: tetratricopeptide repeat protein [Bdellovibrionaceae bacterium]|nr:tetratricopeptide repeat protein [Pseudobdellovibrionaceae bacterium]